MWQGLQAWLRFSAFAAANAAILIAFYLFAIAPVREALTIQQHELDQAAARLARLDLQEARRQLPASAAPDAIARAGQLFLQGGTVNLATAELLSRLRHMAEAHGIGFNSITAGAARNDMDPRLIETRIEFVATTPHVAKFLADLESGPVLLLIRNIKLAAMGAENADSDLLSVALVVQGVMRWPGS